MGGGVLFIKKSWEVFSKSIKHTQWTLFSQNVNKARKKFNITIHEHYFAL